jgi:hypothetical protein
MVVVLQPTVTGFSPTSGSSGTVVDVSGTGFTNITGISINGTPVTIYSVVSPTQITLTVPSNATSGMISVTNSCGTGESVDPFTLSSSSAELDVRLFIEGFYQGGGTLIGIISPSVSDTVTIQLADEQSPHAIVQSQRVNLSTSGYATAYFPSSVNGNAYYIVVKHRNALETWSSIPVSFNGTPISYDFTTTSNKAYGSNESDLQDGSYALFSGDISSSGQGLGFQDGVIEDNDYSSIENAVFLILGGYIVQDLTGDGVVEDADYSLTENNVFYIISVQRP